MLKVAEALTVTTAMKILVVLALLCCLMTVESIKIEYTH